MSDMTTLTVRVKRQDGPNAPSRWEEFTVPRSKYASSNALSVLMQIRENPVTTDGKPTSAPAFDAACLEEVCGSCTMLVNGKVRQGCTALVSEYSPNGEPLTLEPMTKFPLVRDLCVDRAVMFESLIKVKAWIPIDGTYNLGPGPRQSQTLQADRYLMSTCMTCGCCLEVCPQVNEHSAFIGAAAINQTRLFNDHPTGEMNEADRLHALMDEGGIGDCGKAGNCVLACPKEIPLTTSIAAMNRATIVQGLKDFFTNDPEKKHGGQP